MARRLLTAAALLGASVLGSGAIGGCAIGGCTMVNAPSDHSAEPVETDGFCRALAVEFCRGYVECCETAPVDYDLEDCVSRRAAMCDAEATALLTDARVGYDADVAGATLARARAYVDACDAALLSWYWGPDGLYAPLLGTASGGEVCSAELSPTIGAFFACRDEALTCRFSATNWTCSARVPEGQACTTPFDCAEGLYCEGLDRLGTCRPRRPDGRPCIDIDENGADECESGICLAGSCTSPTAQELYCSFDR